MRLRLFKPLHGWRTFWGEVGIIVLGVCIALIAQQVVEAINWKREVAGLRTAVRAEMSENLATYIYRAEQKNCIDSRLDELERLAR
ncbi:MAG: hypothetical protein H0V46_01600 [Sphingomonas sp.]|nr:hypothetical protein [Sphingomonas sp.]